VAVRAARRRHNRPAAFSLDKIADEIVRELVATRFGHRDVLSRAIDTMPWQRLPTINDVSVRHG
jgi:hypothetical protein